MSNDQLRKEAVRRLRAKQNFWRMLGGFVIVFGICVAVWYLGSKEHTWQNFWPVWVAFGLGIALAYSGWAAFGPRQGITDSQVEAEMRKMDPS